MEPLVSILIPAYNTQQWIAETLESALAQTWQRKEIIVVDDGSKDQTLQIVQQFAARGVRAFSQANQGAAAARNTAFSRCQGDYIQWLDADDLLAPDKIEKQVRMLDTISSKRTLLSGAWAYFFHRQRKARFTPTALWCDLTPTEWMLRKMEQNLHMQTDNWLVSRELTEMAGPWDVRLWRDNDGEYFCRVIQASDGIRFVPEARTYYRRSGMRSISYIGGSTRKLESLLISMKLHVQCLRSMEDSARTRAACVSYLQTWLMHFYPERPDLVQEISEIAASLGGNLRIPELRWKYQWLVPALGYQAAKRLQLFLPQCKLGLERWWDRMLFRAQGSQPRVG